MTFRVIHERVGLIWTSDDAEEAEHRAIVAAVNTASTTYLHEGEEPCAGPLPLTLVGEG